MKKLLFLFLGISLFTIQNASAIDSTGCGLGSTILKGKSGKEFQIMAVTTNGTSGSQTFGITSGTSGCDPYGRISGGTGRILAFLENNIDAFALDAAKGEGETLNVVASITNKDVNEIKNIVKNNFDVLFPEDNVNVVEISQKLATLLNVA